MSLPPFILASASAARRRLLENAGIKSQVCKSDFDESSINIEDPVMLVNKLAQCKATVVANQFKDSLILGCDSLLTLGNEIYGKPPSPAEAIKRWQQMRGKKGTLYTGHALFDQRQNQWIIRCGLTDVYFADINDATIDAYIESGEPLNCAGCFALEGKGGLFVERLEGCHSNVIGLSLPLLRDMLNQLGYQVKDFWT